MLWTKGERGKGRFAQERRRLPVSARARTLKFGLSYFLDTLVLPPGLTPPYDLIQPGGGAQVATESC